MPAFTVHMPVGEDAAAPGARLALVREGFSFWAFLLGPIWMLWHRMWIVLVGYLVVLFVLNGAMMLLNVPPGIQTAAGLLFALLVGLEAGTLRRFSLRRWAFKGIVVAEDTDEAEHRFYARLPEADRPLPAPAVAARPLAPPPGNDAQVTGLFPGASR